MIYLKVQDNNGTWSHEVSKSLYINGKPIAKIEDISPSPGLDIDKIEFKGNGTDDGAIIKTGNTTLKISFQNLNKIKELESTD